jgi:hypothetical protein
MRSRKQLRENHRRYCEKEPHRIVGIAVLLLLYTHAKKKEKTYISSGKPLQPHAKPKNMEPTTDEEEEEAFLIAIPKQSSRPRKRPCQNQNPPKSPAQIRNILAKWVHHFLRLKKHTKPLRFAFLTHTTFHHHTVSVVYNAPTHIVAVHFATPLPFVDPPQDIGTSPLDVLQQIVFAAW